MGLAAAKPPLRFVRQAALLMLASNKKNFEDEEPRLI
jgi:hypothetical protein